MLIANTNYDFRQDSRQDEKWITVNGTHVKVEGNGTSKPGDYDELKGAFKNRKNSDADVQWITVNGKHVPIKDGKFSVGGKAYTANRTSNSNLKSTWDKPSNAGVSKYTGKQKKPSAFEKTVKQHERTFKPETESARAERLRREELEDIDERIGDNYINNFLSETPWNEKGMNAVRKEAKEILSAIGSKKTIMDLETYCKKNKLSYEDDDAQEEWREYVSDEYTAAIEDARDYMRKNRPVDMKPAKWT